MSAQDDSAEHLALKRIRRSDGRSVLKAKVSFSSSPVISDEYDGLIKSPLFSALANVTPANNAAADNIILFCIISFSVVVVRLVARRIARGEFPFQR